MERTKMQNARLDIAEKARAAARKMGTVVYILQSADSNFYIGNEYDLEHLEAGQIVVSDVYPS